MRARGAWAAIILIATAGCGRSGLFGPPGATPTPFPPAERIYTVSVRAAVTDDPAGTQQLELDWNPVVDASSYVVYLATDSSLTPDNYDTLPDGQRLDGQTRPATIPLSLRGHEEVFVLVRPVVDGAEKAASPVVSTELLGVGGSGMVPLSTPAWAHHEPNEAFGYPVSLCDFNADGYDDLLVGAHQYEPTAGTIEGRAYIFRGGPTGLRLTGQLIASPVAGDTGSFGAGAACVGDVNQDGYPDYALGAPDYTPTAGGTGIAFLFLGSDTTGDPEQPSPTETWSQNAGVTNNDFMGRFIAAAGNIDADVYPEWVVSRHEHADVTSAGGRVDLYRGGMAADLPARNAFNTPSPDVNGAFFGWGLAPTTGDTNGDGHLELLVGARMQGGPDRGAAYLLNENNGTFDGANALWTTASATDGDRYGIAVAFAGDVNADGYDDILVGSPGYSDNENEAGRALLFLGADAAGPDTAIDWTMEGDSPRAGVGEGVAGVGDVNGDGYDDFMVGALALDVGGTQRAGGAWLHLGDATPDTTPDWEVLGDSASGFLGGALASGDVNGDGSPDLVVGITGYNQVYLNDLYVDRDVLVFFGPPHRSPEAPLIPVVEAGVGSQATLQLSVGESASFPDGLSATHLCEVDWGDGSATEAIGCALVSGQVAVSATHAYDAAGEYVVRVRVANTYGDYGAGSQVATLVRVE